MEEQWIILQRLQVRAWVLLACVSTWANRKKNDAGSSGLSCVEGFIAK